jgi:hypothetical protein
MSVFLLCFSAFISTFQIPVTGNEGTTGLGCEVAMPQTSRQQKHKKMQWAKAQARYDKLNQNEASDSD